MDLGSSMGDERTVSKWIQKKYVSIQGNGLIRPTIGIIGESFECGIEFPGTISYGVIYSEKNLFICILKYTDIGTTVKVR